ncbi:MAG: hypothetical protein AAF716_15725 [Cyanobacteria bacterium P01_D01_bin.1]
MSTLSHSGAAALTVLNSCATTSTALGDRATTDNPIAASVLPGSATTPPSQPQRPREQVRHLLFGTPSSIQTTIQLLHKLGYAEPNDWSRPLPTGKPNEMMAILTKRVSIV